MGAAAAAVPAAPHARPLHRDITLRRAVDHTRGGTAAGCRRSHLPRHAGWWARSGADQVEAVRRELDTEHRYPVLLTVGRLVPQKGQRYLIEAMPEVLRAHPHAQLLIVGMGFLEQKLRAQVDALGLRSSVRFLGRREDVPALMGAADIFVFPRCSKVLACRSWKRARPACRASSPTWDRCQRSSRTASPACSYLPGPQMPGRRDHQAGVRSGADAPLRRGARARVRRTFQIDRSIAQLEGLYEDVLHRRTGAAALRDDLSALSKRRPGAPGTAIVQCRADRLDGRRAGRARPLADLDAR